VNEVSLRLSLAIADGALRRVFGTVEHRGFHVLSCRVDSDASGEQYHVRLVLRGEREPELLTRQLLRLHDVSEACVHADAAAA